MGTILGLFQTQPGSLTLQGQQEGLTANLLLTVFHRAQILPLQ